MLPIGFFASSGTSAQLVSHTILAGFLSLEMIPVPLISSTTSSHQKTER
jgi:hypothetical protein